MCTSHTFLAPAGMGATFFLGACKSYSNHVIPMPRIAKASCLEADLQAVGDTPANGKAQPHHFDYPVTGKRANRTRAHQILIPHIAVPYTSWPWLRASSLLPPVTPAPSDRSECLKGCVASDRSSCSLPIPTDPLRGVRWRNQQRSSQQSRSRECASASTLMKRCGSLDA